MDKKKNVSVVIVAVFALSFVLVYGALPVLSASTDKNVQSVGASSDLTLPISLMDNATSADRPVAVPTLNEWGAVILSLLMLCAVVAVLRLNHRRS